MCFLVFASRSMSKKKHIEINLKLPAVLARGSLMCIIFFLFENYLRLYCDVPCRNTSPVSVCLFRKISTVFLRNLLQNLIINLNLCHTVCQLCLQLECVSYGRTGNAPWKETWGHSEHRKKSQRNTVTATHI